MFVSRVAFNVIFPYLLPRRASLDFIYEFGISLLGVEPYAHRDIVFGSNVERADVVADDSERFV